MKVNGSVVAVLGQGIIGLVLLTALTGTPIIPIVGKVAGVGLVAAGGYVLTRKKVGQSVHDLMRHIYLIGGTGCGKTTKILGDIFLPWVMGKFTPGFKPGAVVIETKDRQTIDDMLNSIPEEEHDRIILFDPYDMFVHDRFIGMNILEQNYQLKTVKTLVGGETISIFKRMWSGTNIGPSSEDIIRNITLANLDIEEGATILEDYRMIKDKEYRQSVGSEIQNPVLRDYFTNNFPEPAKNGQMFNPPLNKLRSFLTDDLALFILAQKTGINFREVIEQGKILIMCLPKGLIGEPLSRLLASIAISKTQLAAFSRVDISKEERIAKPLMVVCDEFQDYCNASFNVFLEQARSMGVSLVLSHQLLKQEGINEGMIQSIMGNVGTKYVFACGVADSAVMAKELRCNRPGQKEQVEPFNEWVLNHLPNFVCIAKKIIGGKRLEPVKEKVPLPPARGDWAERIREASREKYGIAKGVIEADIRERLSKVEMVEFEDEDY